MTFSVTIKVATAIIPKIVKVKIWQSLVALKYDSPIILYYPTGNRQTTQEHDVRDCECLLHRSRYCGRVGHGHPA